jgi:mono/diheme cytochrome c family protein
MKQITTRILPTLLAGLVLSACEKAAEPVAARMPAMAETNSASADAAPLDRHLDPAQVARGRTLYDKHCVECHGVEGKGPPGDWRVRDAQGKYPAPPLDDSAHAWHHPTAALLYTIHEGSPGGQGNMPAWKDKLSEQAMQDVVAYIKSLWSDPVYRLWMKMERQSLEP